MNIRDVIFTRNIINLKHTSTYSYIWYDFHV